MAWEWHWLRGQERWNSAFYGLPHPTLRRLVVQAIFDHQSPGYRDWQRIAIEGMRGRHGQPLLEPLPRQQPIDIEYIR